MRPSDVVKILVVDDLPEQQLVYRSVLEEPGIELVAAASGEEALRHLLRDEFALVLLDVNMPGMDGFETAQLIRGRKRCAHTPILFVTAHADEMQALRGYSYGAVDFILSPIVPDVLRTKVRVFVELFRLNLRVRDRAAQQVAIAEREQAHLNDLLERAADFVARIDADSNLTSINRGGRLMLGYDERGPIPHQLSALFPPPAEEVLRSTGLPTALREGIWFGEAVMRTRDGREVLVSQVVLAHSTPDGQLNHFSLVARDISERRSMERALSESEKRYRQLVERLPAAAYTCDAQGIITLYNDAAVELWGRAPEIGKDRWCGSWRIFRTDGSPLPLDECPMGIAIRTGQSVRGTEIIIERPDGSRRSVLPYPDPILDASGAVIGAVNMLVDITDRKHAEQARDLLAAIVDSTDDAIISKTLDGVITSCNNAAERLFGYEPGELIGRPITTLFPPERWDEEAVILARIRRGESVLPFDTERMTKDGRRINLSVSVSPVRDSQGRVVGASKIARDISERKAAERALSDRETRLRAMFEQAAVGIALLNAEGQIFEPNERLAQIVGRGVEELSRLTCEELMHPEDWARTKLMIDQVARGGRMECAVENRCRRSDGSWAWVNVTVSPLLGEQGAPRLIAIVEDIGARKLAEQEVRRHREQLEQLVAERTADLESSHERLRLTERLAAVGTLAAGLGHDMGNLLLPLRMRVDALERTPLPDEARNDVRAIAEACEYLKRLSQGLRLFALNPEAGATTGDRTDLAVWWEDVSTFLRNALPRGVELEAGFPPGLPLAGISPHALTQAVYNLVQNAGDAMKSRGRGRVTVAASVAARGDVVLEVSDDGPGMTEEVLSRCLEPFFTTKTRGISTGLGLALVHGAVRKVGGTVDIRSKPGEGTTFRLIIPSIGPDELGSAAGSDPRAACVNIADARMRAFAEAELRSLGVVTTLEPWSPHTPASLVLLDHAGDRMTELTAFLSADRARRVIVVGACPAPAPARQIVLLGDRPPVSRIRRALHDAVRAQSGRLEEVTT